MTHLTELDNVSIAQICVYVPALAIAILLCVRHGFGRSSGWFYLILFSVIRILGGALELATINDRTNVGLLIGASTLQSIGVSPLLLVMLGLLSRVLLSIRQTRDTIITPQHIRIVQLLVLVGLILGIVGGSMTGNIISDAIDSGNLDYTVPVLSRAGLALMIAGFGLLVIASALTATHMSAAAPGEKRLFLAIALATPFVVVRFVFSGIASFDHNPDFRSFGGSAKYPNFLVGMAVVMEMCAVAIFESIGLTLKKVHRPAVGQTEESIPLGRQGQHYDPRAKSGHQTGTETV